MLLFNNNAMISGRYLEAQIWWVLILPVQDSRLVVSYWDLGHRRICLCQVAGGFLGVQTSSLKLWQRSIVLDTVFSYGLYLVLPQKMCSAHSAPIAPFLGVETERKKLSARIRVPCRYHNRCIILVRSKSIQYQAVKGFSMSLLVAF